MTFKERQGYQFYVYVAPGMIEYFYTKEEAQEYAELHNAEVSKV